MQGETEPAAIIIHYQKRTGLMHIKIEGFSIGEEEKIAQLLEQVAKGIKKPELQNQLVQNAIKKEEERKR